MPPRAGWRRRGIWCALALLLVSSLPALAQQAAPAAAAPSEASQRPAQRPVEKITVAPATARNAELESRVKAVLAKSSGVFGVSVRHVERGEFAGINDAERFEMASVFKVGVLATLYKQVEEGKISLDQRVTFEHPERYFGSGVLATLRPGLQPTVYDLAVLMITVSDNAATDMLCERVGISNINARVRELGAEGFGMKYCTRGLILDAAGLGAPKYRDLTTQTMGEASRALTPEERRRNQQQYLRECGNCTTPQAMSTLLTKMLAGEAGNPDSTRQMLRIMGQQHFNERLPRWVPGRVAHKTGSLGNPVWVANDAGIISLPGGQHVVVSVFGHGTAWDNDGASRKAATADADERIAEIGKVVWDYYAGRETPGPAAGQ